MENNKKALALVLSTVITVLIEKKKKQQLKKRRALWSRKWLLKRGSGCDHAELLIKELQFEDIDSFQNYTRMNKDTFGKLLEKIEPNISRKNTVMRESIPASTRLLLTLRFLATGQTYRALSYDFRISVPAISKLVPETLNAICNALKEDYLKVPNTEDEWMKVAKDFENQWNFPNCLGALDGKHIAFRAKKKDGSFYYNYKGFHSIILLALVDSNYRFLYIDVGCNGRSNDAGAYANSSLSTAITDNLFNFPIESNVSGTAEKLPYVIVSDDAFRLTPRVLKPYGQRSTTEEKVFNYRLSRARRVVENAFGILANKFQILQKDINLDVDKVELITFTACVLHNYIRTEDGMKYMDVRDKENTTDLALLPGSWRKNVFLTRLDKPAGNRSKDAGIEVRNQFSKYFNTTGFVPWQWEAIKKFNF